MFGQQNGAVQLTSNHREWKQLYIQEQERLLKGLSGHDVTIEHVGSTAIVNVPAQPIIDIALGIERTADFNALRNNLQGLGYEERNIQGAEERKLWIFGTGHDCSFHVHLTHRGSATWHNHVIFRAALRSSASLRQEYAVLKRGLADRNPEDRQSYTNGKQEFIERVIRQYSPKRPRFTREAVVTEIESALERAKNVLLVGRRDAGKTYFVTKMLIPHLQSKGIAVRYYKNMDEEIGEPPQDAVVIFDEFEILEDREQLAEMHPEEVPYYSDMYIAKVHTWLRKAASVTNRRICILSRDEEDIGNSMNIPSFDFASSVVAIEVPAWKAE